jgi:uncharacterized surface protein with fasciclin (FAS1) repeats
MNLIKLKFSNLLALLAFFFCFIFIVSASEPKIKFLFDFSDRSAAKQWVSVNDSVMGGISEGGFRITDDKTLVFSGNLSLENRGGFTSIRTKAKDLNLGGFERITVRVKGDGRTYSLNLMTSSRSAASSYRAPINTKKDTWQEVSLNLKDFVYTSFGRVITTAPTLKAKDIRRIGFTLSDKKAGPFRLEVHWIKAEKNSTAIAGSVIKLQDDPDGNKDIVDIAAAAGNFKTLAAALKAAELIQTLKGPGPFTVFAPTDDAFAKLPEGTVESLIKPENRAKLVEILTYHVVPGRVTASQAAGLPKANTVQGSSVLISADDGKVRIDGATVVKADINASNGIIHVIDKVILPKDIVAIADGAGKFKILLAAAKAAGLVDALKAKGPLTVFAPTDEAFQALPDGTIEDLLQPENREKLAAILKYHVVAGKITLGTQQPKTLQGGTVDIRPTDSFRVDEAKVLLSDILATNGVVHVIDRVLLPELPEPSPVRKAMGVIELAIERGVPLFNSGKPDACAAIYEVTVKSLLDGHKEALDASDRNRLKKALTDIRNDHRPSQQSWILRYALDDVYFSLRTRN